MADANYTPAGWAWAASKDKTDLDNPEDIRMLMKCERCGAMTTGGGLSRERHDAFHTALADLFERVEKWASAEASSGAGIAAADADFDPYNG